MRYLRGIKNLRFQIVIILGSKCYGSQKKIVSVLLRTIEGMGFSRRETVHPLAVDDIHFCSKWVGFEMSGIP